MKPTSAFIFAAFAAVAAHAQPASAAQAASTTRSGMPTGWSVRLTPQQLIHNARSAGCFDRVFRDNLEGDAGRGCANGDGGAVQVYTDRATFMAAVAPGYAENSFDDVLPGMSGGLLYAKAGYEYTIFTQFNSHGGLYNGEGFVSTDRVNDAVAVFFLSGNPVHALGGDMWPSDFSLRPVAGTIAFDVWLEDGTIETLTPDAAGNFRGFTSESPIVLLVIDAPDLESAPDGESPDRWATLDNLVVGDVQ